MPTQYSIQRILVPLDGSEYGERAIPWTKALCNEQTNVILLEVVAPGREVRDFRGRIIGTVEKITEGFHQMATEQLAAARSRWFPERENVTLVIAEGDPAEQILWAAEQHSADLIVMSSRGRGAIGRFASGSVADRVMRHSAVPVVVIGPEGPAFDTAEVKRIIAPVDGSALSLGALPVAAAMARLTGAPVEIVNVIEPTLEEFPAAYHGVQPTPVLYRDDMNQIREAEAQELVAAALAQLEAAGAVASGDVYSGNVSRTLAELLQPGDILVIASHGRKGLPRWVLGSTALKLIQHGAAPILVVTREFLERAETPTGGSS